MSNIQYAPSQLQYGNQTAQTHVNQVTNNHLFAEKFEHWGIIALGSIAANKKKEVDLSLFNVQTPISLKSLYVFAKDAVSDEIKSFKILKKMTDGTKMELGEMRLYWNQLPYQFPAGAILMPDNVISLQPNKAIDNIYIYFKPVYVAHYLDASN